MRRAQFDLRLRRRRVAGKPGAATSGTTAAGFVLHGIGLLLIAGSVDVYLRAL
jgi:hypothetical protein